MKYKIALITASIGNPDKPELTITSECQKEFDDYGVDIYNASNELIANFENVLIKDTVFSEFVNDEDLTLKAYSYTVLLK